jgi:uracil-DNA glycosylase
LGDRLKSTLTETVKSYKEYLSQYLPLVHPSPRNRIWQKKNPWFEKDVVPHLQKMIGKNV